MDSARSSLATAVGRLHGASARWIEAVPVREEWRGEVAWEGEVQVFELDGHPEAARAYAWTHEADSGDTRTVAVLGKPPVNSARDAVRAAIVAEHRGE